MSCLRILVVDDHDLVRAGVAMAAREIAKDSEVYSAASIGEALNVFKHCPGVDLVLLDLVLPDAVGFSGLDAILECNPDVPIILLTADARKETMDEAFHKGASGYIPKSSNLTIIVNALKIILAGGRYLPSEMLGRGAKAVASRPFNWYAAGGESDNSSGRASMASETGSKRDLSFVPDTSGLTLRQTMVAALLSQGLSNKEICRELDLSVSTVKTHVASILRALRTSSRTRAMAILSAQPHLLKSEKTADA